jgi:hypothetical protein
MLDAVPCRLLKVFVRVALAASTNTIAHFIFPATLPKPDNSLSSQLVSVIGAADQNRVFGDQMLEKTDGHIYKLRGGRAAAATKGAAVLVQQRLEYVVSQKYEFVQSDLQLHYRTPVHIYASKPFRTFAHHHIISHSIQCRSRFPSVLSS